jgi:hypothetical protein
MFTDTRIADLNGPLLYCGPARFTVRTAEPPAKRFVAQSEPVFGDLNGPLAYWGPASTSRSRPALAVSRR